MKKLLLIAFSFSLLTSFGQNEPVLENNAPSLKWYQVNTPHFRVIFPRGFEDQGRRVASSLEKIRDEEAKSMGVAPRRISVILQNQSSVSNGFVSILPRRSEFFTMPSQDYNFMGTNDWLNILISHEYRHIVQYQHATRGFNKLFYYLFGATTLAGMSQAAAPDWFWEGDAVATETAFTPSGRGKIPNFGLVFKTNLLEGREFNYHKQLLRSYKHNIPNEYVLGFYMISYLRKRTNDPDIWEKVTKRSWNVPFIPFAFSNAIKKESGMYVTKLYREMAKDFRKKWTDELAQLTFNDFEKIPVKRRRTYTDYLFPQPMEDGSVLVMKQGIGDIEKFVLLKGGKEKRVFIPGYMNDAGMLSATDSRIVWNEYGFSPRWAMKNYSLVKMFDRQTGKRTVLGSGKDRYGSAALSPDGTKVATVKNTANYQTQLTILDAATGDVVKEFANPGNHFISMPRWFGDGERIAFLRTTPEGKTISVIDYASGAMADVLPVSNENYGHPVPVGDFILYNSPLTGIDNIFAVRTASGERYQITSSRYGAYNPSVSKDGRDLYYNDQTRNGLDVVKIPFNPETWKPVIQPSKPVEFYSHLVAQEGNENILTAVEAQDLPVTKYSKARGLINPYTWGLNVDSDLTTATVGISSRDILSTTSIDLGYIFDINERTGSYQARVSYQGWFPIIDVSVAYADRSVDEGNIPYLRVDGADTTEVVENLTFKWKEFTMQAGIRIPLTLTRSRFNSNVTLGNHVGYRAAYDFTNSIDGGGRLLPSRFPQYIFRDYVDYGGLIFNHFSLTAHRLLKQNRRDINSKWGQRLFVNSYSTPFGGDYSGTLFSAYAIGYFPGLLKHHSLWGYWGYQYTDYPLVSTRTGEGVNNYLFRNSIPLPRGQAVTRLRDFYSMSVNYTMPVWYPDVALGPFLNIQRLRTNFFCDYGFGLRPAFSAAENRVVDVSRSYTSVGVEAKLDINIMRFLPQFDIGVRYVKGLDPATSEVELLIGTFNF